MVAQLNCRLKILIVEALRYDAHSRWIDRPRAAESFARKFVPHLGALPSFTCPPVEAQHPDLRHEFTLAVVGPPDDHVNE